MLITMINSAVFSDKFTIADRRSLDMGATTGQHPKKPGLILHFLEAAQAKVTHNHMPKKVQDKMNEFLQFVDSDVDPQLDAIMLTLGVPPVCLTLMATGALQLWLLVF